MDLRIQRHRHMNQAENARNGLLFGVVAGFWLAASMWGWDALLLSQAHSDLPWLKFVLGAPALIVLAALAGWLTARLDKSALGALFWLLTGIVSVWIASHVPFEVQSLAIGFLEPRFAGLQMYPFVDSIQLRMRLLYFIVAVLSAIGGSLEMFFVEAASNANNQLIRILRLAFCLIIFIPTGLVVDNLINADLRLPVQGTHQLIQFGLEVREGGVSKEAQREMGVRALRIFGDNILSPYRIMLGFYDPETLEDTIVHVDFSGVWGSCSLIRGRPFVCRFSADRYLNPVACLVKKGSAEACRLKTAPGYKGLPAGIFSTLDSMSLQYGIQGQRGTAILTVIEDGEGDQIECVLRDTGDVLLERCQPAADLQFDVLPLSPTPTPRVPVDSIQPLVPPTEQSEFGTSLPKDLIETASLDTSFLNNAPHYKLSVQISPDLLSFQGKALIEYTSQEEDQLDELYIRLLPNGHGSYGNGSLNITSITVNGIRADYELSVQETAVKVTLSDSLQKGDKAAVEVAFAGQVPQDFGGSITPAGYGIFNLSNGVLALSGWYPILAVYDEKGWNLDPTSAIGDSVFSDVGFYSVDVSLPGDQVIVSTGVMTSKEIDDGIAQYHFESGPARDFFIITSSDFEHISRAVAETTINVYMKSRDKLAGEKVLQAAAASLEIYNDKFGSYPFTELDIVAAPMRNALGVEFPGIVLIDQELYAQPDKPEFKITVAHEVAHQWWYGVVGNDVFDDPWMDEALATYSSSLYYEFGVGLQHSTGLIDYWKQGYSRLSAEGNDDRISAELYHFESLDNPSIYGGIVYTKGALFFDALRSEIGDQAFFQGLKAYYQMNAFKIAQVEDLLSSFEKASGRQLDDFYQSWLY